MEYSVIYFDKDDVLFVPKNVTVRYSCCVLEFQDQFALISKPLQTLKKEFMKEETYFENTTSLIGRTPLNLYTLYSKSFIDYSLEEILV